MLVITLFDYLYWEYVYSIYVCVECFVCVYACVYD